MTCIQILLFKLGVIQSGDAVYTTLGVLGDVAFYFLPFLVATSAADRFECNKYMAITLVGVLMHPTWMSLVTEEVTSVLLFGFIPIRLLSYSSSVIPPLLTVYLLSKAEKLLTKVIPASLSTVLVPALELLILGPVILVLVGPFSQWASDIPSSRFRSQAKTARFWQTATLPSTPLQAFRPAFSSAPSIH